MDSIFKKSDSIDMEEFLNNLDVEDETLYENADAYVKPISLQSDSDTAMAVDELKKGNIVLLNIADLGRRNALKLRDMVSTIRSQVESIDGDIARISADRVILTPSRVKIIKKRE